MDYYADFGYNREYHLTLRNLKKKKEEEHHYYIGTYLSPKIEDVSKRYTKAIWNFLYMINKDWLNSNKSKEEQVIAIQLTKYCNWTPYYPDEKGFAIEEVKKGTIIYPDYENKDGIKISE